MKGFNLVYIACSINNITIHKVNTHTSTLTNLIVNILLQRTLYFNKEPNPIPVVRNDQPDTDCNQIGS